MGLKDFIKKSVKRFKKTNKIFYLNFLLFLPVFLAFLIVMFQLALFIRPLIQFNAQVVPSRDEPKLSSKTLNKAK